MEVGTIKGALLEFIVRNLLKSCGFTNVKADGTYTYESSGLFYINGKGAAHDADVIVNPPIQMPFSYPYQLVFECKAYKATTSLSIVRNAHGLRLDLNDFEVVTLDSLESRKNNRRSTYAIETRNRFLYQVGVAAVGNFSSPAIEFASNNKIPLLSLTWFLGPSIVHAFDRITKEYLQGESPDVKYALYKYFKDRTGSKETEEYDRARIILNTSNPISAITQFAEEATKRSYIGLLETGDIVFLYTLEEDHILSESNRFGVLKAEIDWDTEDRNVWELSVHRDNEDIYTSVYRFFVPQRIYNHWSRFNYNRTKAIDIKQEFFARIFVFNQRYNEDAPFTIININEEWLEQAKERLNTYQ